MSIDKSKLSRDELLALLDKLTIENESLSNKLNEANENLDKAYARIRALEEEREKLILKYDKVFTQNKIRNINVFCGTSEKTSFEESTINDIEENQSQVKKERKHGRPEGSKNWITKLMETRNPDEIITYDNTFINESGQHLCPNCNSVLTKIGEDISYTIEVVKTYKIIQHVRPKYSCSKCETVIQHEATNVFNHSPLSSSFVANVIDNKCNLLLPLDRQAQYLKNLDIPVAKQTLAKVCVDSGDMLIPIYNKLKDELVSQPAIHIDETTFKSIELKDRKKSYMFILASNIYTDKQVRLYSFKPDRKTEDIEAYLTNYDGFVNVDKYAGYNKLIENGIKVQYCLVHARRKFNDITKTLSNSQLKHSKANEIKSEIDKLYTLERKYKKDKLGPDKIKENRNSDEYLKIVNKIKDLINNTIADEGSLLESAINYMKTDLDLFFTYLKSGLVSPDNNQAERTVKPFAVGRKNFLFSATTTGAKTTGILFSVVQTAKANGLIPELYIKHLLDNINKVEIDDLLPWSEKIPQNILIPKKI